MLENILRDNGIKIVVWKRKWTIGIEVPLFRGCVPHQALNTTLIELERMDFAASRFDRTEGSVAAAEIKHADCTFHILPIETCNSGLHAPVRAALLDEGLTGIPGRAALRFDNT